MGLIFGFAPFIIMAIGTRFLPVALCLAAAFAIALYKMATTLAARKVPKILEAGNFLLFGGALAYGYLAHIEWTKDALGLVTNGGLGLVVLFGIAIGKPFTLQYAAEQVPPEMRTNPRFIMANRVMSGAWALAFVLMFALNLASVTGHVPANLYAPLNLVIIGGAGYFTYWFPRHLRAKATASA